MLELLTPGESREILRARQRGMACYFPAYPDAEAQAINTLRAARKFMKHAPADCQLCGQGVAHQHNVPARDAGSATTD